MNAAIENEVARELIARIANSASPAEALALFRCAAPLLVKCKIVFAAQRGAIPGFAVNRTFSAGAAVRSLFNTEKVLVLDVETVRDMANGKATYPIDYSISLDTQALSYLEPYIDCRHARLPKDFVEVFEFIAREDVFVDPLPYRLENLFNLDEPEAAEKIFKKLRAYEVLRNLDSLWLKNREEVRPTLSEQELTKLAQEQIARMFRDRADKSLMETVRFRHQMMYCQLLKMVLIHLKAPSGNADQKIEEFADFLDKELATMSGREMVLARSYFKSGQKLTFFGKMQKKQNDLFDVLNGMAWDLWHIRQMEECMTLSPSVGARYYFPAFLTFDKRLIEIMDLYPLKACAFITGQNEPMPVFDGDFFQVIAETPNAQQGFFQRFYSEEARASRTARRSKAKGALAQIVEDLETELSKVAVVAKPSK